MKSDLATLNPPPLSHSQSDQSPQQNRLPKLVERLTLKNSLDAVIARATVRKLAASFGYSRLDQVRIATAVFEIARHIVFYAGQGEIVISWQEDDSRHQGLIFFCNDRGRNNSELTSILQTGGWKTEDKLNLLGLKKMADEFEISKDPELGNCVTAAIWRK